MAEALGVNAETRNAGRLGGVPTARSASGCAGCRHPVALHRNGKSACTAFACHAGPSTACPDCGGGTNPALAGSCGTCRGTGSVRLPCQAFIHADQVQLAS